MSVIPGIVRYGRESSHWLVDRIEKERVKAAKHFAALNQEDTDA